MRYPLGPDTRIDYDSDRHAIVVDKSTCNELRPKTWTSADAAGLPILPGLLRWFQAVDDSSLRFSGNSGRAG